MITVVALVLAVAGAAWAQEPECQWRNLPGLPRAISGQAVGVSGGALLVAGGSYFPVSVFEGGRKQWVDTLFVLEAGAREWRQFRLPRRLAYAGFVSAEDGLILIGGGDERRNLREVTKWTWDGRRVRRQRLPALPEAAANLSAAVLDGVIYAAGGQADPAARTAHRRLWALDLNRTGAGWRELEPWPGPGRILPVMAAAGGSVWLASGAELLEGAEGAVTRRYLTDVHRFQPGSGWTRMPDMPRAAVAAPAAADASGRVLVFGGDDGEFAARVQELKDRHPGFPRSILALNPQTGRWSEIGTIPVGLVTTGAVVYEGRIVIAGGEDRPGHRRATVLSGGVSPSDR